MAKPDTDDERQRKILWRAHKRRERQEWYIRQLRRHGLALLKLVTAILAAAGAAWTLGQKMGWW